MTPKSTHRPPTIENDQDTKLWLRNKVADATQLHKSYTGQMPTHIVVADYYYDAIKKMLNGDGGSPELKINGLTIIKRSEIVIDPDLLA